MEGSITKKLWPSSSHSMTARILPLKIGLK
jgi:hypothetical protein